MPEPERYYFPSTAYAPNNKFPVLVYRSILPEPVTEESTTEYLTRNKWSKGVRSRPFIFPTRIFRFLALI